MNKTALTIFVIGLVISGIIFFSARSNLSTGSSSNTSIQNIQIKDGIQYITIEAKGGYSPRISNAQAGIPTKLVIKTNGTYDCSASLVIRSLNYQKILDQNGEDVIDVGIPKAGEPLRGVCSMGMYNFLVNFQ